MLYFRIFGFPSAGTSQSESFILLSDVTTNCNLLVEAWIAGTLANGERERKREVSSSVLRFEFAEGVATLEEADVKEPCIWNSDVTPNHHK